MPPPTQRCWLLLLAAVALFPGGSVAAGQSPGLQLRATLLVFSGSRDPDFDVDGPCAAALQALRVTGQRAPPPQRLGYRGFRLSGPDSASLPSLVYADAAAEQLLLEAALAAGVVPRSVELHIRAEIERVDREFDWVPAANDSTNHGNATTDPTEDSGAACTAPVVGGDAGGPTYDPSTDVCGFFVSHVSENNCYDYGTDIATNTFAQPGRGSGHKWDNNTCESVRAAAERDGLTWQGTELPATDPTEGHYVALFIWPDTNFHWVRRDRGGFWSHKPGGTAVRNVDNQGTTILDPSKGDFSPWSQFCGYMQVVPSKVCTGTGHCINRAAQDFVI